MRRLPSHGHNRRPVYKTREAWLAAPDHTIDRDEEQCTNSSGHQRVSPPNHGLAMEAQFRGSYYVWCCRRGHSLPGNDPVSGRRRTLPTLEVARREGRAAYGALARFWFTQAATLRKTARQWGRILP